MTTELYTYIESLDPQIMVNFLSAVTNTLPECYWTKSNVVDFYMYGDHIGNITISEENIVGKITGIKLFKLLQAIPDFYSMLRGTTNAKDLNEEYLNGEDLY